MSQKDLNTVSGALSRAPIYLVKVLMLGVYLDAKKFDVKNVASCFEELCNFLDAVDSMLSEIKDYEAEVASYYDYY